MNYFFVFFVLILFSIDISEIKYQGIFTVIYQASLTAVSSAAIASDLVIINTIIFTEWFIEFALCLPALFIAVATVKAVAMIITLASVAAITLLCHLKPAQPLDIKYSKSQDDDIQMADISVAHICVKKQSPLPPPDNGIVEPLPLNLLSLTSAPIESHNVGDLPLDLPQLATKTVSRMTYADAVGYAHMEGRKPRNSDFLGYDVFIGELFPDIVAPSVEPNLLETDHISVTPLTYADAVGYERMEVHKPSNPYFVFGYDFYIADLFPDELFTSSQPNSFRTPVTCMTYADAVGYEYMEIRKPRNGNALGYDLYIGDLFPEYEVPFVSSKSAAFDSLNAAKNDQEYPQGSPDSPAPRSRLPAPVRRLSYAEAVGYEFVAVTKPRSTSVYEYDISIAGLFEDEDILPIKSQVEESFVSIENDRAQHILSVEQVPARRLSYADAVGYDKFEKFIRTDTNEPFVYLGDLFREIEVSPSPRVRRLSYAEAVIFGESEIPRYSKSVGSSEYEKTILRSVNNYNKLIL